MSRDRIVIAGAGVVGLSTAWFLRRAGLEVTVVDATGVAAGASAGNAGWIMPGRAVPITEPSSIRAGVSGLFHRGGPFRIASWSRPSTWSFLAAFALHSTPARWARAREAMRGLNDASIAAFEDMASGGVPPTFTSPVTAAFATVREAQHIPPGPDLETIDPRDAALQIPQLSARVGAVVRMLGTRYIQPAEFVRALADAAVSRGVVIEAGEVIDVRPGPRLVLRDRDITADAVVIATGARMGTLARKLGSSVGFAAGRGYSFFAPTDEPAPSPIYLPTERLACTPAPGGIRIAGMMEITTPDAPASLRVFDDMANAADRLLAGVRFSERRDEWSGDRPLTADGLPLIGATALPGVHLAGGHGMWGVTQGAATGRLLAESVVTGRTPAAIEALSPLR